jgi:hypothetical protein
MNLRRIWYCCRRLTTRFLAPGQNGGQRKANHQPDGNVPLFSLEPPPANQQQQRSQEDDTQVGIERARPFGAKAIPVRAKTLLPQTALCHIHVHLYGLI